MKRYYYVFVVLTYKTTCDLPEFLESVKGKFKDYKVVIVNSYFDETTKREFELIAEKYHCDFLNIENKGYSFGNNVGIEHCIKNYKFKYLIVSNPDIIVESNDFNYRKNENRRIVIAPRIHNKTGKNQNPYWVWNNQFAEWLIYVGYKTKNRGILYTGIGINKIIRIIFISIANKNNTQYKVFAAHGSFVIISYLALKNVMPLYDEKMFLFAEEALLAHKLRKEAIPTIFTNDVRIFHKEDGSMSVSKINEDDELRKSVLYYYNKIKKTSRSSN